MQVKGYVLGEMVVQGPKINLPETLGSACGAGWEGRRETSP